MFLKDAYLFCNNITLQLADDVFDLADAAVHGLMVLEEELEVHVLRSICLVSVCSYPLILHSLTHSNTQLILKLHFQEAGVKGGDREKLVMALLQAIAEADTKCVTNFREHWAVGWLTAMECISNYCCASINASMLSFVHRASS